MKRLAILTALILTIFLAARCDRSTDTAKAPLTEIRLGYFPNLSHAQAVLADSSGDFAAAVAPAKFTSRQFNAGPSLIEALFTNQIDVGYVGPGPVINAVAKSHGQGIRVISGAAANGVIIVARPGSGINSMADLVSKKIATPQQGNTQDIAARHYLMTTLNQPDTSNVLPIQNTDQTGLMSRGDIDAAWAPEPWGSLLISKVGAKKIGEEKDLWPNHEFSLTVIVTTPEFLAAHPDVIEKLLQVNHTWTTRLGTSPTQYVPQLEKAIATLTGKPLPPGVVADAITHIKFTDEPLPETFEANAQWSYDLKFSTQKVSLDGVMDLAILKKVQAPNTQEK